MYVVLHSQSFVCSFIRSYESFVVRLALCMSAVVVAVAVCRCRSLIGVGASVRFAIDVRSVYSLCVDGFLFSFVCKRFGKVEEGRFIAVILVLFRHSDSRTNRANTRFRISTSIFAVVLYTTRIL